MQRVITGVLLLAAVVAAGACGEDAQRRAEPAVTTSSTEAASTTEGAGAAATTTTAPVGGGAGPVLTVVGRNIAWEPTTLSAPAGVEFTIKIDNQDRGIPHNFHLSAPGAEIRTEVVPGPEVQEEKVKIDQPGTYEFVCDVHPAMKGQLTVG